MGQEERMVEEGFSLHSEQETDSWKEQPGATFQDMVPYLTQCSTLAILLKVSKHREVASLA